MGLSPAEFLECGPGKASLTALGGGKPLEQSIFKTYYYRFERPVDRHAHLPL
jgi:hypothetical protein